MATGTTASTRNGGMVIPELKHGPRELARRHGALAGELVDAVVDAFALVERLVPESRLTESLSSVTAAVSLGMSGGSWLGGVAIDGAGDVLPPDGFRVRAGVITVRFGAPLPTGDASGAAGRQALADAAHASVLAQLRRSA